MAYYRAPSDRPELPSGYSYALESNRIYIYHQTKNARVCLRCLAGKRQYWNKWENAALAAWKHAYENKKEQ